MMKKIWFRIAEQLLEVIIPSDTEWRRLLPSFVPFKCCCLQEEHPMCTLYVIDEPLVFDRDMAVELTEVTGVLGSSCRLFEMYGSYVMELQLVEGGEWYRMECDRNFSMARAYIGKSRHLCGEALNAFLMVLFAQVSVLHRTFLIHSSVVIKDGLGYAFLGKSGTGKSTHSSLWLRHLEGTELLNDDNPAIHIDDAGRVYIYGTPWSGKTPCYKNQMAELAAWVRLEQAPKNQFSKKVGMDALITLMPSCSSMRWNNRLFTALCDLLEMVIAKVPVGYLECLPDKEAANLCYNEITKIVKQ